MKKQTISLLVLLPAASGSFFSCGNIMNRNVGVSEFDNIQANEMTHPFGDTVKPACNFIINLTYAFKPSDEKMRDNLNTYLLSACFGKKCMNMIAEEAVKKYTKKYVNDYRKDLEPIHRKDEQDKESAEDTGAWYSYYESIESRVQLYTGHLFVHRIDYNEYTGDAHGIYISIFLNLDLHVLAPVYLDDLFVGDYKEQLTDLLWNQLMANGKVATRQELEDAGYVTTGDLTPTENFYLSKEGITFYYNIYDIAPYMVGPVKITLPHEMMQHLLGNGTMVLNEVRNS